MFEIEEIIDANTKSDICNNILRSLPGWFGVEQSIADYVAQVRSLPFYASYDQENDLPVGFAAVKPHSPYAAEICVMGVLEEYHRKGIGKMLTSSCEDYCRKSKMEFLTVKTLDESREDEGYRNTRMFYTGIGFRPIEVFPMLWDEDNPCLLMAKYISQKKGRGLFR